MTKEEIYEAEFGLLSVRPTSTVKQCALIAMDEYAKQQAIAFDVWKRPKKTATNGLYIVMEKID